MPARAQRGWRDPPTVEDGRPARGPRAPEPVEEGRPAQRDKAIARRDINRQADQKLGVHRRVEAAAVEPDGGLAAVRANEARAPGAQRRDLVVGRVAPAVRDERLNAVWRGRRMGSFCF
jgi:hypothetical protein